jgi:Fe-S-cluster containining protein
MQNYKHTDVSKLKNEAKKFEPEWNRFYQKNKKKLEGLDITIHRLHEEISEQTDCLQCANCCRTLGPMITDKDIERMAKALKIKTSDIMEKYLRTDEDGDIVFKSMPCPFLGDDNYCAIYEARPKACREYPHTDRKKFYQIFKLSVKNAYTCPIVFGVLQGLCSESDAPRNKR